MTEKEIKKTIQQIINREGLFAGYSDEQADKKIRKLKNKLKKLKNV